MRKRALILFITVRKFVLGAFAVLRRVHNKSHISSPIPFVMEKETRPLIVLEI